MVNWEMFEMKENTFSVSAMKCLDMLLGYESAICMHLCVSNPDHLHYVSMTRHWLLATAKEAGKEKL